MTFFLDTKSGAIQPVTGNEVVAVQAGVALGEIDVVKEYGLSTAGTPQAANNSAILERAFLDATTLNMGVYVGPGTYYIEPGNVWAAPLCRFRGAGSGHTIFCPVSNSTANAFTFGNDATFWENGQGYIRDFMVFGGVPGVSLLSLATTGYSSVQINNLKHTAIERVACAGHDIGFDFINNCYGSQGNQLWARYAQSNVALNIRTGSASGSDMPFFNCWLDGYVAGINIAGGATAIHFYGGHYGAAGGATPALGVLVLGKDYTSGTIGGVGTTAFHGGTFEGWQLCPAILGYCGFITTFYGTNFLATNTTASMATQVFTLGNAQNAQLGFDGCTLVGYFSDAALGTVTGETGWWHLYERGWTSSGPSQINGTNYSTAFLSSIAQQSGIGGAFGFQRYNYDSLLVLNGVGVDLNGLQLRSTTNQGSSYNLIGTPVIGISDKTAQTAALSGITLATAPTSAGYMIKWTASISVAATTGAATSTLGGATGFTVTYTDATTSGSITTSAEPYATATANTVGLQISGVVFIYAKSGQGITYSFGYTSNTAAQMAYNLHVTCVQEG